MTVVRSIVCDRVRSYVSLDLDGELSALERRMLGGHLDRCADCRAFAADATGFTRAIRAAGPELPARGVTVSLPRRRATGFRLVRGAAAAAVVLVAGGLGTALAPEGERYSGSQLEASAPTIKLIDGYIQPALGPKPLSGPANALTIAL